MAKQFQIHKNASAQYWWRLLADNNRTVADSAETYMNKADCRAMIEWIQRNAATTPIVDLTGERY
jgi:uncharacterized protein YegP (UPF0339 family)